MLGRKKITYSERMGKGGWQINNVNSLAGTQSGGEISQRLNLFTGKEIKVNDFPTWKKLPFLWVVGEGLSGGGGPMTEKGNACRRNLFAGASSGESAKRWGLRGHYKFVSPQRLLEMNRFIKHKAILPCGR